ncbi:hypothetical protein [Clostridium kluyveri]|uniref:Uncharacterized protein n=1 Tax=Clostridium kluyveri TaxID=1534 RepID=A0A1L5FBY5_CLOKL|nr:hypothetical protein [Clostridium kluyveri]APM40528.1 hypothetical protein BS101_18250 [Clostridium kluyveri]
MNYNDIADYVEYMEKEIQKMNDIINKLKTCKKSHQDWYNSSMNVILKSNISGNGTPEINNIRTLKNNTDSHYRNFRQKLMQIDFMNMWIALEKINENGNNVYNILKIDKFINNMKENYLKIHDFRSINVNSSQDYANIINTIDSMIHYYNKIIIEINNIKSIRESLNVGTEPSNFSIRLLNEDNKFNATLESLKIIENMYNIICLITGISNEEYPLKYNRIESGTVLASLIGNISAVAIVGGVIKFSYEVYKEQFSWKARQEKIQGDIKVRGEYIKLIKETAELKLELNDPELQNKLQDLEKLNSELFKNNPSIILNGEKIGIPELKNSKLPDEFFLTGNLYKIQDNDKSFNEK